MIMRIVEEEAEPMKIIQNQLREEFKYLPLEEIKLIVDLYLERLMVAMKLQNEMPDMSHIDTDQVALVMFVRFYPESSKTAKEAQDWAMKQEKSYILEAFNFLERVETALKMAKLIKEIKS